MAIDKTEAIIKLAKTYLGYPLLELEIDDDQINDIFLQQALREYYSYRPYEYRIEVTGSGEGTVAIVPSLTNDTTVTNDNHYFIGVVHVSNPMNMAASLSGIGNLLVGTSYSGSNMQDMAIFNQDENIMAMQFAGTMGDMYGGNDIYVQHNLVDNKIYFSNFIGTVTATLGYGFSTVDFISQNHFKILAVMTALYLAKATRQARASIQIQGDIQLSGDVLDQVIDSLTLELEPLIEDIRTPFILA